MEVGFKGENDSLHRVCLGYALTTSPGCGCQAMLWPIAMIAQSDRIMKSFARSHCGSKVQIRRSILVGLLEAIPSLLLSAWK